MRLSLKWILGCYTDGGFNVITWIILVDMEMKNVPDNNGSRSFGQKCNTCNNFFCNAYFSLDIHITTISRNTQFNFVSFCFFLAMGKPSKKNKLK